MVPESHRAAAVEEGQNRDLLLRRADWRFLLPDPHPQWSVCYAGGRLSRATVLVSQEIVSPVEAMPGSCGLAVVSDPDARTLQAAWEALCPGGMLYGEWYSPLTGGPPQIRGQVERAGFRATHSYWPWPWPDRGATLFWLPLEAPAALDYFLISRPPSQSLLEGVFRSILRPAWKLARQARLLVPVCVTARKPAASSPHPESQDDDLLQAVREGWQAWGFGRRPDSLYWLMLTGGLTSINKVVKFAFNASDRAPRLVVKHARVPESIPALVREAENLDSLEGLPEGGPPNVPRLLFLKQSQEAFALGETVVNGNPLYTLLRGENYRSLALKATAWLGQLVTRGPPIPRSEWWARIGGPALDAFERKFGQELGAGLVERIKDQLLSLEALPAAFEHRDFSPWNVLVTDTGQLAVLDWEGGEPHGLAGMDLIYFLTFLAFFHDGAMETGEFRPAYRSAQDPESFTGSVQAECLRIYFEALGLNSGIARPLRTLAWTIHSLSIFPRLGSPVDRNGEEDVTPFIQLLVEELGGG